MQTVRCVLSFSTSSHFLNCSTRVSYKSFRENSVVQLSLFGQGDYSIHRCTHLQIWFACLNSPSLYEPLEMVDRAKEVRLPYSNFISQPILDQRPKHRYQLLSLLKLPGNHTIDRGFLAKSVKT